MNQINLDSQTLIAQAHQARARAYAPYSNYKVGAAILMANGQIYTGCNVENAVYPLTICAERVAITKAISEMAAVSETAAISEAVANDSRTILAVAVVTENGGSPCGACRQVIREFANPDTPIFIAKTDGTYHEYTLAYLLPESFSVEDLENRG